MPIFICSALTLPKRFYKPDFLRRKAALFVKQMQTFRRNYCLQSLAQKSHMTCDKRPEPQNAASDFPAGADGLKTLYAVSDSLSVAEWLGIGLKGVICTVDRQ